MDDPHPVDPGIFRGWADLVAGELSKLAPDFGYANLAVRGRLFDRIVTEQVGPTLEMKPDLISFAAGGNDVLRRSCDPPTLMRRFEQVIGELRGTGADVLIFRFADVMSRLPGNKLIAPRILYLNEAVGEIAERQGARLVDLWADGEFANPAMWSTDRLHMSLFGHQRVAAHVLTRLDVTPPAQWWELQPWPGRKSWARTLADDLQWAGKHLAPWVKRRLQGRSSGDNVMPKRPTLGPLA